MLWARQPRKPVGAFLSWSVGKLHHPPPHAADTSVFILFGITAEPFLVGRWREGTAVLACLSGFYREVVWDSCAAPPTNQGERLHKPKGEFFICTMLKCGFFSGSVQGVKHWHGCFSVVACTIHYSLCRKTLHCIRCIQRTLLGNEAVCFRDYLLPPGAAKQYASPSNPRLDGR